MYIQAHWSDAALRSLSQEIETTIALISNNPLMFRQSDVAHVRCVVIKKHNTLYYRINQQKHKVEIISFFAHRQHPNKRQL